MQSDPFALLRHRFIDGAGLEFDDHYRAAQLPLVAPNHPRALETLPGRDYRNGSYDRARTSLVMDLAPALVDSLIFRTVCERLRITTFAPKVAFDALAKRMKTLHATIVGDVPFVAATHAAAVRSIANKVGVLRPRLHGPFIGDFNVGRIYLPLEFCKPRELRALAEWNDLFGKPLPRLVAVGILNLSEELSASESAQLAQLISEWDLAPSPIAVDRLSWTQTHDDLTLRSHRLESIDLKENLQ
ncbi:hypothetical protein HQQ80_20545 [Microbacteriaceae bacterium VKM Ac-2855]|nr:hypothetical protein [Microbacteriaceae bacterium VKM Ac-2855]